MMNKTQVELQKADEFCHITNKLRSWPSFKKGVHGLRWHVAINTHVDTNKLKPLGEEMAFANVQRKAIDLAYFQQKSNILESVFLCA